MTDDKIREIWLAVTGVDELAVAWDVIGFARATEQASRRSALEKAAKVCDELADGWNLTAQGATDGRYDFMAEAGDRCADEIRALSGSKET